MIRKILSVVLALMMLLSVMPMSVFAEDGVWTADTSWYNTADSEFTINSEEQLAGLAAIVNGTADGINTDNFNGKTIKLGKDIDLKGKQWTPIGYCGKSFTGIFDGGDNSISNLYAVYELSNTSVNNTIGLFGKIESPAIIKNVIINNATVKGSLNVAVLVGYAYTGKEISNCHVKGDIVVDAWWYSGVIAGYGYISNVINCTVIGNDGSYIKGNNGSYIGGIMGFRGEGSNIKIADCSVENLTITGVDRVGGISGMAHYGNEISNCTATNVTILATDPDCTSVGLIAGANNGTSAQPTVVVNNGTDNTTAKIGDKEVTSATGGTNANGVTEATIVGTDVKFDEDGKIVSGNFEVTPPESAVAEGVEIKENADGSVSVGDAVNTVPKVATVTFNGTTTEAMSLADAFVYAKANNGSTITLIEKNIDLTGWVAPNMDVCTFTVEGNGTTITGLTGPLVESATTGSAFVAINDLTVSGANITSDVKSDHSGKINASAFIAVAGYHDVTLKNCHVVNSIVSVPADKEAYVGGLIGYWAGQGKLVIDGCSVNGTTLKADGSVAALIGHSNGNTVDIKNTTIGNNTIVNLGNEPEKVASVIGTVVSGDGHRIAVTETEKSMGYNGEEAVTLNVIGRRYNAVTFTGGSYFTDPSIASVGEGVVTYEDVCELKNGKWYVLGIVAQVGETKYSTLQEAIDNANGAEIAVIKDFAEAGIKITATQTAVIDLNGHTLTGDILSCGKLTVKNGTMVNNSFVSCIESNGADAELIVTDLIATSNRHALRIDGGKATINSGSYTTTVEGSSCYAANIGGDIATDVIINGGEFYSNEKASTQGTSVMIKNNLCTTVINGGIFNTASDHSLENYGTMTITGGTFYGSIVNNDNNISGGTFEKDPSKYLVEGKVVKLTDGMYEVADAAAKIDGNCYETLQAAVNAAQSGDIITLLSDIEITESITVAVDDVIILDLAGKTIAGTDTNTTGNYGLIDNLGTLTVKDSVGTGAITLTAETDRAWDAYSAVIANRGGNLVIDGAVIKHLGGTSMAYAIDNNSTLGDTVLTITNGEVLSVNYRAIRQFANSTVHKNTVTVSGGLVKGGSATLGNNAWSTAIWMQSPNANANQAELTVTADAKVGSINVYTSDATNYTLSVAGSALIQDDPNGAASVLNNVSDENFEIENTDGNYGLVEQPTVDFVSQIKLVEDYKPAKNNVGGWDVEPPYTMLFLAGIDTPKYENAGFEITINGETRDFEVEERTVYETFTLNGVVYTPEALIGEDCHYFIYYYISFSDAMVEANPTINVKAYVKDLETGVKIYIAERDAKLIG